LQKFSIENRVIALDLRGHGLSDKPSRGYDMPQLVENLETTLTLLKVKGKFVLVGHSDGNRGRNQTSAYIEARTQFANLVIEADRAVYSQVVVRASACAQTTLFSEHVPVE
jgi:pimeloyl-ACP methyl ester carboxylesterase